MSTMASSAGPALQDRSRTGTSQAPAGDGGRFQRAQPGGPGRVYW